MPLIIDDGNNYFIYGPGGTPIEQINGSTVQYLHQDQLGSTRLITDSSGATAATYEFDAYGNATSHAGSVSTSLQYAGQYFDAESGLYWMRARYYDPTTGQFVSRDLAAMITRQPYAYSGNDAVNLQDPSGLWPSLGGAVSDFEYGAAVVHDTFTGGGYDAETLFPAQSHVVANESGGVLNGILLGQGATVLGSLGLGGNVDWSSFEAQAGAAPGAIPDAPFAAAAYDAIPLARIQALSHPSRLVVPRTGNIVKPLAASSKIIGGIRKVASGAGMTLTPTIRLPIGITIHGMLGIQRGSTSGVARCK